MCTSHTDLSTCVCSIDVQLCIDALQTDRPEVGGINNEQHCDTGLLAGTNSNNDKADRQARLTAFSCLSHATCHFLQSGLKTIYAVGNRADYVKKRLLTNMKILAQSARLRSLE